MAMCIVVHVAKGVSLNSFFIRACMAEAVGSTAVGVPWNSRPHRPWFVPCPAHAPVSGVATLAHRVVLLECRGRPLRAS